VTRKETADGKHRRPSAEELDEHISIPLDPATVIEGMTQVDAEKVAKAMPKRDRKPSS
jgi:hypothetical protein